MNGRLDSLLAAEKAAGETVEEAERKARGIRTAIPEQISAIEEEYRSEQDKYEKLALEKLDRELEELQAQLDELTKPGVVEGMKLAGFSVGVILLCVVGFILIGGAIFLFFRR